MGSEDYQPAPRREIRPGVTIRPRIVAIYRQWAGATGAYSFLPRFRASALFLVVRFLFEFRSDLLGGDRQLVDPDADRVPDRVPE
ncbi:MAG: hypothetical protein ACI8VE_002157 [Natrialbaceae archaeon]|jgi:hypothetical protein